MIIPTKGQELLAQRITTKLGELGSEIFDSYRRGTPMYLDLDRVKREVLQVITEETSDVSLRN